MTNIPRALCLTCEVEYKPEKNDVIVEMIAKMGSYYTIAADRWECPVCGHKIVYGFGNGPITQHFEPDHETWVERADHKVAFLEAWDASIHSSSILELDATAIRVSNALHRAEKIVQRLKNMLSRANKAIKDRMEEKE